MSQFISHVMSSHVMYAKITLEILSVSLYYLAKQLSHVKLIIIFNHHLIVNISFKVSRYLPNVPFSFFIQTRNHSPNHCIWLFCLFFIFSFLSSFTHSIFFSSAVEIEPRALWILSKLSTTEMFPGPPSHSLVQTPVSISTAVTGPVATEGLLLLTGGVL